jgi:hypothetical protein
MGWGSKESKSLISFGQGFRVDRLGAGDWLPAFIAPLKFAI